MTRIRTSLSSAPHSPTTPDEMQTMRAKAWREFGVLVVGPDDLLNWDDRQRLTNIGNRMYGARK